MPHGGRTRHALAAVRLVVPDAEARLEQADHVAVGQQLATRALHARQQHLRPTQPAGSSAKCTEQAWEAAILGGSSRVKHLYRHLRLKQCTVSFKTWAWAPCNTASNQLGTGNMHVAAPATQHACCCWAPCATHPSTYSGHAVLRVLTQQDAAQLHAWFTPACSARCDFQTTSCAP